MRSLDCRSEVALSAKQEGKTTISCLPSYDPHRPAHRRAHQPLNQRGTPRAGTRPRQQCRPGSQGAEEEDAARGHLPRDEAPRPLRETLREESPREGGSHQPRPQARDQEIAARGPAADEASGGPRGPGKRRPPACPPLLISAPASPTTSIKILATKHFSTAHSSATTSSTRPPPQPTPSTTLQQITLATTQRHRHERSSSNPPPPPNLHPRPNHSANAATRGFLHK